MGPLCEKYNLYPVWVSAPSYSFSNSFVASGGFSDLISAVSRIKKKKDDEMGLLLNQIALCTDK